jgi:enoyl-CoA hydratase/carnithine racemase
VATEIQPTDAPATDEVIVTRDGPVLTLMFNRPQARNAMTWNMYERLYQTCEEVDADDSIRVMVLRGAGGKAFVAGHRHQPVHQVHVGRGRPGVRAQRRAARPGASGW